jgi:hypothetical protein
VTWQEQYRQVSMLANKVSGVYMSVSKLYILPAQEYVPRRFPHSPWFLNIIVSRLEVCCYSPAELRRQIKRL